MNMSYCRFENTVNDMMDCINNMDISESASEYEKRARKRFVELCAQVVEDHGEELEDEIDLFREAWELLCADLAEGLHQYDYWEQVPSKIQQKYLLKAKDA